MPRATLACQSWRGRSQVNSKVALQAKSQKPEPRFNRVLAFDCYSKGRMIFIQRAMGSARKESHASQVPEFSLRLRLLVTSFPARMSDSNWSSLPVALLNAC
jgi:hypothetical protein